MSEFHRRRAPTGPVTMSGTRADAQGLEWHHSDYGPDFVADIVHLGRREDCRWHYRSHPTGRPAREAILPAGDHWPRFADAVARAHFRAAVTGWRYRCRKDRSNGLWWITETSYRIRGYATREDLT